MPVQRATVIWLLGLLCIPGWLLWKGENSMAATTPHTPPPAVAELEKFVFHSDKYTSNRVPRKLRAEEVAQFIGTRVDQKASTDVLQQTEKVITFYDVQEVTEQLKRLLADPELSSDLAKGIPLDRALANVGQPADKEVAGRYYEQLVPRASTYEDFVELISVYSALGSAASADSLRHQIAARRSALLAKGPSDYEAKTGAAKLEDFNNVQVPRAYKANLAKDAILKNRDRPARIRQEIEIYLQISNSYSEILQPWAAARLRRETWAPQPEQQVVRRDDPNGRAELVSAFKSYEAGLPQVRSIPEQSLPSVQVRILRAIEFFGGLLSPEERMFIDKNAGMQIDVLSNE
ncbi:MAG: hypothetical protein WB952_15355 [Terriglobales bacterium]